jgi:hypothetical protein
MSSNSISTTTLEIVHSNLWGPSPIVSKNDFRYYVVFFRYYVVFVDDFTKFSWIYFLRTKNELSSVFTSFKAQVKNLLTTNIKILRIDGGTEFKPITHLFPQIIHQTSCPYTPQQNDVSERKHRHIIELSLAMIQQVSIPLHFWDEVFASAIYLINRLPSSSHEIPLFTKFLQQQPSYHQFWILGCLCFPYICPYNNHKLQPRSIPCVFLGYAMS